MLEGRDFTDDDDGRHPRVLVVNKAFADRFFPGENAIGKQIESGATSQRDPRGVTDRPRDRRRRRQCAAVRARAGSGTHLLLSLQAAAVGTAVAHRAIDAARGRDRAGRAGRSWRRSMPQVPVHDIGHSRACCRKAWRRRDFSRCSWRASPASASMLTATGLYGLLAYPCRDARGRLASAWRSAPAAAASVRWSCRGR